MLAQYGVCDGDPNSFAYINNMLKEMPPPLL